MGLFLDNRFASVCAERMEFCPWGCFPTKPIAPLQTPHVATAPPAYLPHNTPRYGRCARAILARSDRLDADFRAGVNFALTAFYEVRLNGVLRSSHVALGIAA